MNIPNGSDSQCSLHHSGVLCGACQFGLSLSLYGSNCIACPSYWPALLVVIILATLLAGVLLVAVVLVLNLTVAVGTLNGAIFYANVVNINRTLLFPFQSPNYITVFIAWLNLEIGFDTCFFEGMDAYGKIWLQLLFPVYIIVLVILVIVVGERSQRFAHLIGKKNPVATLATLVLISFDKLFHVVIGAFSFAILDYPDGSHEAVWLLDANVKYFQGKHIPLFITSLLILVVCVSYTAVVFLWQWLLRCPDKRCFKWTRSQKLNLFLKTYHAPYTIKHRYWTGLLLIIRVILSISSVLNVSNDSRVNLLLLGIVMILLLFLVGRCSPVYEKPIVEFLEVTFYTNMAVLFIFSFFFLETGKGQTIIAYISGSAAICQFLISIAYRVVKEFMPNNKLRTCARIKEILIKEDELLNYPPVDDDGKNPIGRTLLSLDHHRENYKPLTQRDCKVEREIICDYGSNSRTDSGIAIDEISDSESSPLITSSSSHGYYS